MSDYIDCPDCGGMGDKGWPPRTCGRCGGVGNVLRRCDNELSVPPLTDPQARSTPNPEAGPDA